jgi:hypothetical protein
MKPRIPLQIALLCGALALLGACAAPRPATLADTGDASLEQCDQVTGSRIRSATRKHCEPVGQPMRSYSAEELRSTGEMDLSEALRQLDPSFR